MYGDPVKRLGFALLALLIPTSAAMAATKSFTGSVDANWSNGANWADGTPPVAGDDLSFDVLSANTQMVNDLAPGTVFNSLQFHDYANNFGYGVSGNDFGITGGIDTPASSVVFRVSITLYASQTWSGNISLDPSAALDVGSYTLTVESSLVVHGVISGTGSVNLLDGSAHFTAQNTFTGSTTVNAYLQCGCTLSGPVDVNGRRGHLVLGDSYPGGQAVPQVGPLTISNGALELVGVPAASGDLSLDSTSSFYYYLPGGSGPLSVTGSVSLGGAQLSFYSGTSLGPIGTEYTLIENDGNDPVSGTFSDPNGDLPEGSRYGSSLQISYHGGDGNDVTLTVIAPLISTTTTLGASPNPAFVGQDIVLTATVATASGAADGTVSFYDNGISPYSEAAPPYGPGNLLGTAPVQNGTASLTITAWSSLIVMPGTNIPYPHYLNARFAPSDPGYENSRSAQIAVYVQQRPTALSLRMSPNPTISGSMTTLTATVTSQYGSPTGSVNFRELLPSGSRSLGSVPLTGGSAAMSAGPFSVGTHRIFVDYTADSQEWASGSFTSDDLVVVNGAPTATGITVSPNSISIAQTTTLTATVTSTDRTPTGSVNFYDDAVLLAAEPLISGAAVAVAGPFSLGVHAITATYVPADGSGFAGSTSEVVPLTVDIGAVPTTTVLDVTPAQSLRGQAVTLTATVIADGGTISGDVLFTDGDQTLASMPVTSPTVSMTTTALGVGTHVLRATFVPLSPAYAPSTSNTVVHVVVDGTVRRRAARH
ncbi:MAG TPA: Ig-like domain-containing protein [Thermoanaerobaculia bacterium]|nr:Ig-like domain-containing protein [Thermoanaerobaculia bacterium]